LRWGLSVMGSKDKMTTEKKNMFTQLMEFIPQVRQEVKKVTWPSRRETTLTTSFVFIFAVIAAIYFALIDQASYKIIEFILGFSR
jgi:preprotein translocase subunit SecE